MVTPGSCQLGAPAVSALAVHLGQHGAVPFDPALADRLRSQLVEFEVREVAMFGGRSFMVNERLAVAAASDGSLLVRCAPDDVDELSVMPGAQQATMRRKPMSRGWIRVEVEAIQDESALARWVDAAVSHATESEK